MRLRICFLLVLICLLSACAATLSTSEASGQICPSWTGYATDTPCDIKIWKNVVSSKKEVDLGGYEMMRITIIGADVIFDGGQNFTVHRDDGESVDYDNLRLYPGTYIVKKEDESSPASFLLVNPHTGKMVNMSAEFVRLQK